MYRRLMYLSPALALAGCLTGSYLIHKIDHTVIVGKTGERFGYRIQGGFAMDDDFVPDIAVSAPNPGTDTVYLFSADDLAAGGSLSMDDAVAFTGESGGEAGWAMAAGNLHGNDLYGDLAIAAPSEASGKGRIYVLAGGSLTKTPSASVVATLVGVSSGEYAGWSVAVGNLNGDAYQDLIIGACGGYGKAYVVYGPLSSGETSLSSADATFTTTALQSRLGCAVGAADLDGDGKDEVVLGAYQASLIQNVAPGAHGRVYVLWDAPSGSKDIDSIDDATVLIGEMATQSLGYSISNAGDANGDGIDDLVIGAPFHYCSFASDHPNLAGGLGCSLEPPGTAYLVLGDKSAWETGEQSITEAAAAVFGGEEGHDEVGVSVAFSGDVNGDGFDDMLVGTRGIDDVFLMYGGEGLSFGGMESFTTSDAHVTFDGSVQGLGLGRSVSWAGDLNQDGSSDLIMGAPGQKWYADGPQDTEGEVYVVLGVADEE